MIAYIKGRLVEKTPTCLVIETTGGVAYMVHISLNTYDKVQSLEDVMIYTHCVIKEDAHILYGFFEESERAIFRLLITVNGIGPNTARIILSSLGVGEVLGAIAAENVSAFKSVKGVGTKTAQRIIIDLKDKIGKESIQNIDKITISYNNNKNEALSALVSLGFAKQLAEATLDKIIKVEQGDLSVEALIKKALRLL